MKIAINTRLLLKNKLEGIGVFTSEIFKRIVVNNPQHQFIFLFDRPFHNSFIYAKNIIPIVVQPATRHPFLWWYWFEFKIPKILKQYDVDLFISPDGYLSLATNIKQIAVIHDLNFEHYPNDLPFLTQKYYRYFFPKYAEKANKIVTVSNFSKKDIITTYKINEDKIDVVYNGVNPIFKPIIDKLKEKNKLKYTHGSEYFLYVGALNPRKNIVNLIKAFELYKQKKSTTKLLIVGKRMHLSSEMKKVLDDCNKKNDIIFFSDLNTNIIHQLIGSAKALLLISKFEGFGIPIIEAMACKTPVITSNTTSMPEIAKDFATLVNPNNVKDIADAMQMKDKKTNDNHLNKACTYVNKFNWDNSALEMWRIINNVINA